jgi:hypothetical protein
MTSGIAGKQMRRVGGCLFRAKGPTWQGEELSADRSRQGLERDPASLWAAGALVQQDLATWRN